MKLKKILCPTLIIILMVITVALVGSYFTSMGMTWYDTALIQPSATPPKWAFPVAWNIIFTLTTISAIIVWIKGKKAKHFALVIGLFILNAILNVVWSLLFFKLQLIFPAFIEMIFLEATLIALLILTWPISRLASFLLLPYTLWVGFATYLTYLIWALN